jgi:hypothetical protein
MSETKQENEGSEEAKKAEGIADSVQQEKEPDEKIKLSGIVANTLLKKPDVDSEPKEIENPPQSESPLVKSRQGSQVSFNLPPDATGKPVANQIEDIIINPIHTVSPVLTPANEESEETQNENTSIRSSFHAIPFFGDNEIHSYKDSRIAEKQHMISPHNSTVSKETLTPVLITSPEGYHPISPEEQHLVANDVPAPLTEDQILSAPDELKTTARSTFDPIEFSDDGDGCNDGEEICEEQNADNTEVYDTIELEAGSSPNSQRRKAIIDVTNNNKPENATKSREIPNISKLPLEQLSAESAQAEEAIEVFSNTGRLPSSELRSKFVSRIEKNKINALENEDYDRVYDLEIISQKANEKMTNELAEEMNKEQIAQTKEKLKQANDEYKEFNKEWDKRIKEAEEQCKERIRKVFEAHEEELNAFDEKWNDENYLSRFAKPSPHLLQLKAQERSMVLAKLFHRAKEMRRESALIEAQDTKNAQKRAIDEMKIQKKNMTTRQDTELECINNKCMEQLDIIKRQKSIEERPYRKRIKKLEIQLEDLQRNDGNQFKQVTYYQAQQFTSRTVPEREYPSVRATSRILMSRKKEVPPKLAIKPLGQVTLNERKKRNIRVKAAVASSLK